MKRVIKIGTSSLSKKDGTINLEIIKALVMQIRHLMQEGHKVVLVTSGAVGCGKSLIQKNAFYKNKEFYQKKEYSAKEKTILSGIGQNKLLTYYSEEFEKVNLLVEQVLVAGKKDLENSTLLENLELCFELGIVPIVNANDTVYDKELTLDCNKRFSDNDLLASELAHEINADDLILITNVLGYLDEENNVIPQIEYNEIEDLLSKTNSEVSSGGTGGMCSKLKASQKSGCDTYIIHNSQISHISSILDGKRVGTKICKQGK